MEIEPYSHEEAVFWGDNGVDRRRRPETASGLANPKVSISSCPKVLSKRLRLP